MELLMRFLQLVFFFNFVSCFQVDHEKRGVSSSLLATSPIDSFLESIGLKKFDSSNETMKTRIAITGSSGLIGSALIQENFDAIVHLAGESVASGSGPLGFLGRWDEEKKKKILESRVIGTKCIVNAIDQLKSPPKVLICSSAVGFYGYESGDTEFNESSSKGNGFLADVVEKWETEALKAQSSRTRVVCIRTGVVLDENGGALAKLLPIFKASLGGNIGSGKQYFSWVSLRDVVNIIVSLIQNRKKLNIQGVVNVCSPQPCTNAMFTRALSKAISRPAIFPIPEPIGKLIFGQMGDEMLFGGQRVIPKKLLDEQFEFQDTDIEQYLAEILT